MSITVWTSLPECRDMNIPDKIAELIRGTLFKLAHYEAGHGDEHDADDKARDVALQRSLRLLRELYALHVGRDEADGFIAGCHRQAALAVGGGVGPGA
jgi:hypothetical protein